MAQPESTRDYLPEDALPQDLTGCKVETPKGWTGVVGKPVASNEEPSREVDFGRGDVGVRTEQVLRGRVIEVPSPKER